MERVEVHRSQERSLKDMAGQVLMSGRFLEAVADPHDCLNIFFPQLLADFAYMNIYCAIDNIDIGTPNVIKEVLSTKYQPRRVSKKI